MSSKKELEDKIKVLKDEVRKLRGEAKDLAVKSEGLDQSTYGVILKDDSFHIVTIKHDEKNAIIENVEDIGKHVRIAATKIQKLVTDDLVKLNKGR